MFNDLRRKIVITISVFTTFFILLISISFFVLYQEINAREYETNLVSSIDLEVSYASYLINSIFNRLNSFSERNEIQTDNINEGRIRSMLDSYTLSDNLILGTTFYTQEGIYTNSSTTEAPLLSELKTNQTINDYLLNNQVDPFLFIRDGAIASSYPNSEFYRQNGIFSIIKGIKSNNSFLLIDLNLSEMNRTFFSLDENLYGGYTVYAKYQNLILNLDGKENDLEEYYHNKTIRGDNIHYYTATLSNFEIIVKTPITYLINAERNLILILVAIDVGLVILVLFSGLILGFYISEPLKIINEKMKQTSFLDWQK